MKNLLFALILVAVTFAGSLAQTRLGYLREAQGSFPYTSYKPSSTNKLSGINLDMRINYSLLGSLIFRNSDSKFIIGDHIGAGFGVGYWKKTGDDFPLMIGFDLQFGVKAAYSVSDDLEVGVKYMIGAAEYFTDLKNDFSLGQKPSIIPSARFKNIMGSVGFGTAKTGDGGSGNTGNFMMAEGRYLFDVDADRNVFLFFRFENYTGETLGFTQKGNQIIFGIGFM
jgi:hypothetical protein